MWFCVTLNNFCNITLIIWLQTNLFNINYIIYKFIMSYPSGLGSCDLTIVWPNRWGMGNTWNTRYQFPSISLSMLLYALLVIMAYECKLSNFNWCMNRQKNVRHTKRSIKCLCILSRNICQQILNLESPEVAAKKKHFSTWRLVGNWRWALFPPDSALCKKFLKNPGKFWGFELGNILDSNCLPQPPEAEALSVWPWGFSHKFRKAETDPERTRTALISREWLQTEPLPVRRSGWNMPLAKQNTGQKLWNYFEWLPRELMPKYFVATCRHQITTSRANRPTYASFRFETLQVTLTSRYFKYTWHPSNKHGWVENHSLVKETIILVLDLLSEEWSWFWSA